MKDLSPIIQLCLNPTRFLARLDVSAPGVPLPPPPILWKACLSDYRNHRNIRYHSGRYTLQPLLIPKSSLFFGLGFSFRLYRHLLQKLCFLQTISFLGYSVPAILRNVASPTKYLD